MAPRQRPDDLKRALLDVVGLRFTAQERAILAGRLRFDDQPALSQQVIANRLKVSQPHVSNLERALVDKLQREAARRRDHRAKARDLHEAFDEVQVAMTAMKAALPSRPLKVAGFGKRATGPAGRQSRAG